MRSSAAKVCAEEEIYEHDAPPTRLRARTLFYSEGEEDAEFLSGATPVEEK